MASLRSIVRALTPPVLWEGLRQTSGRPPARRYQGVSTPFNMSALHTGRFADAFDRANANDPAQTDADELRLRAHQAYVFAAVALRARGDYLSAGVSYAVCAKVVFDLLLKGTGRTLHLVDPFQNGDAHANDGFCTDAGFVARIFDRDPAVRFHLSAIPAAFPLTLPEGLAFVHLNTGDEDAEIASLPYLIEHVNPGGVILIDSYGWQQFAARYDTVAAAAGARIFPLVTAQGVLLKD